MKLHRTALIVALAGLASACASTRPATSAAPTPADQTIGAGASDAAEQPAAVADGTAAALPEDAATAPAPAEPAAPASADAAGSDAEQDFAAIYGQDASPAQPGASPSYDPWEKYNRKMHAFNNAVDRTVARPVARGYAKVVPQPVRKGIGNFFDNLRSPLTMFNQLLQGRPSDAWDTLGRFLMNTTIGIAGFFDPASRAHVPKRDEDFGQTLATWGWRSSRYFELPFFGPRTVRDTFGLAGDIPLSPTHYVEDDTVRYGLQGLQLVDTRARLLSLDDLRQGATDDYALIRDAWLQRRNYQIQKDLRHPQSDDSLPDYLRDPEQEDRPDVPVNAMPVPNFGG